MLGAWPKSFADYRLNSLVDIIIRVPKKYVLRIATD